MTIPTRVPGIPYGPQPVTVGHTAALAMPPRLVVIHDTSNNASAADEAAYASRRSLDGATSAHVYVDESGPLGSLPLNLQAWAAYSYANARGWHIEMRGYNAGMPGAVKPATIAHTARLTRLLCDLGGIPMVKLTPAQVAAGQRGICGHRDITIGLGVGDHDDPGAAFNWTAFIAAVQEDDMALTDDDVRKIWSYFLGASGPTTGVTAQSGYANTVELRKDLAALSATVAAIAARVDLDPVELAALADAARAAAAEGAKAGVLASADAIASAVAAKLPASGVTRDDVEAALREVFADAGSTAE